MQQSSNKVECFHCRGAHYIRDCDRYKKDKKCYSDDWQYWKRQAYKAVHKYTHKSKEPVNEVISKETSSGAGVLCRL